MTTRLQFAVDFTKRVISPMRLCTITCKNGNVIRIAENQKSISLIDPVFPDSGEQIWYAIPGCFISAVKLASGSAIGSTQIDATLSDDGPFKLRDVLFGTFDAAKVNLFIVNRDAPDFSNNMGPFYSGFVSNITYRPQRSGQGKVTFEVQTSTPRAQLPFMQTYGPMCRTDLGSAKLCRIPILPPDALAQETLVLGDFRRTNFDFSNTPDGYRNKILEVTTAGTTGTGTAAFNDTIDGTTAWGSVVFTTRNSWTRYARIASVVDAVTVTLDSVPDPRAVDGWYAQGVMIFRSGFMSGRAFEIGAWTNSSMTVVGYGIPFVDAIAVGDFVEVYPGCDKTTGPNGCLRFSNLINYQGEPFWLGKSASTATVG